MDQQVTLLKKKFKTLLLILGFLLTAVILFVFLSGRFEAKVETVKRSDATIAYYTRGYGKPIILIPGFGMTMQHWDPALLRHLSQTNKLVIFDPRAVGSSRGGEKSLTETQLAEDVIDLMDHLKISKAHVLGWSSGSFTAQILAAQHPTRVDHLILISTAPGGGKTIDGSEEIGREIQKNLAESWEKRFVPYMFYSKNAANQYLERLESAYKSKEIPTGPPMSIDAKIAYEEATADIKQETKRYEGLSKITSRTLLISGSRDNLLKPENAKRVVSQIPNSRLSVIADAGHAVLFEKNDEVARLIKTFLKE